MKVYKIDYYDWVASNLSLKKTIVWYKEQYGICEIGVVIECDINKEGFWSEADKQGVREFISFKECLKNFNSNEEPFIIATADY